MHYSLSQRFTILRQTWPIIVANASVPLLGLVDTAVIGRTGNATALGALAISNLMFNFIYWAFGFFRMSTTGFIAQARGDNNLDEAQAVFIRSQILAFFCGCVLLLGQAFIAVGAFSLLQASTGVEDAAGQYFSIRIWGAPATLALYGVMGVCIGFGKTKLLLLIQLSLNLLNILLDVLFVAAFDMGVKGIALGTLIAEWTTLILASFLIHRYIFSGSKSARSVWLRGSHFAQGKMAELFLVNGNMFLRTLFLLAGFAWFTNASARFGDSVLAGNHILLMLISFSAFFLDGFAFVAEEKVGAAVGAKDWQKATQNIYLTSELAIVAAFCLAVAILVFGHFGLSLLTNDANVAAQALKFLPWAAVYIVISVAAFQLDGIFIGAMLSAAMRNATVLSFIIFISFYFLIGNNYEGTGLWCSFIIFVLARGISLALYWPLLRRQFA